MVQQRLANRCATVVRGVELPVELGEGVLGGEGVAEELLDALRAFVAVFERCLHAVGEVVVHRDAKGARHGCTVHRAAA